MFTIIVYRFVVEISKMSNLYNYKKLKMLIQNSSFGTLYRKRKLLEIRKKFLDISFGRNYIFKV